MQCIEFDKVFGIFLIVCFGIVFECGNMIIK